MFHVVLDTNILHQEGLFSRNMQLLARLASFDQVTVYIPELVKREYISKIDAEASSNFQSINAKLTDILKKTSRTNPLYDDLTRAQSTLNGIAKRLIVAFSEDFEAWQTTAKAKILHFNPAQIDAVFDHYFAGSGVFSQPKHRADIPDAFINSCIETLAEKASLVDVIIKDGVFRKHLKNLDGITIYDGLDNYLQSPHIVERIAILDAQSKRTDTLKLFFGSAAFQRQLTAYLRKSDDLISDIHVDGSDIVALDVLGVGAVSNQTIYFLETESLSEIQYGGVTQIGEGHFSIEIFFMADASIDYYAGRSEYKKLPKQRRDEIDILESLDSAYELSEDRLFAFTGHTEVRFDAKFSAEEVLTHGKNLSRGHSEISIELEINKAEVIS